MLQAEEDYEGDLEKRQYGHLLSPRGRERERGWGLEDVVRVTIKFTRSPHKVLKDSYDSSPPRW